MPIVTQVPVLVAGALLAAAIAKVGVAVKGAALAATGKGTVLAGAAGVPAVSQAAAPTFGQAIESRLVAAWQGIEAEGEMLIADAETWGERELGVVENAIVVTWNVYAPKAVALIEGYVQAALAELGSGASVDQIAESVVAQDSASASPFLAGAVSACLKAVVAALMASL